MSEVVVKLLEKPAGGYRPIGLFSTCMRVWAKARCRLCKRWYAERHIPALNLAPRRWASDPVWRTMVSWEAGEEDEVVAEIGTDVSKCYEQVSHELLQAIGDRLGYPGMVLRVMLAAYRAGRTIVLNNGAAADTVYPTRGIVAGASTATLEISCYVLEAVARLLRDGGPGLSINVHVDDWSFTYQGKSWRAGYHILDRTFRQARQLVEEGLHLPFDPAKTYVVASHERLGGALEAKFLPEEQRGCTTSVRKLGIDYGFQRQRNLRKVLKHRLKVAEARLPRIRQLAAGRGQYHRVFITGVVPSVLYAAECRPLPTATLRWLRQHSCKAAGLAGPGVAYNWIWALRPPREDPACLAWEKPVLRWCREVWYSAHPAAAAGHGDRLGADTLGQALSQTLHRLEQAMEDCKAWKGDNTQLPDGPTAAYVQALAVVGWYPLSWHEIELHDGSIGDLQCTSPARMKALYRARWEDVQWEDAAFKKHLEYSEALGGRRFDPTPLRRAFRGTGKAALTVGQKRGLIRMLVGSWPDGTNLHKWGKVVTVPQCPHCQATDDTLHHRLWECHHKGQPLTEEEQALNPECIGGPSPPWIRLGLTVAPPPPAVRHAQPRVQGYVADGDIEGMRMLCKDGPVYVDGSCCSPALSKLARAGTSLVQMDPEDPTKVLKAVGITHPDWAPGEASYGEHEAVRWAQRFCEKGVELVADCSSVLTSWAKGEAWALGPDRPMAPSWPGAHEHIGSIRKTKAHRSWAQAVADGDQADFHGNEAADSWAKKAAAVSELPVNVIKEYPLQVKAATQLVRGLARAVARQRPPVELRRAPRQQPARRPAEQTTRGRPHCWSWCRELFAWHCTVCHSVSGARKEGATCTQARGTLGKLRQAVGHGHSVIQAVTQDGKPFFGCIRCGHYAEAMARNLLEPCKHKKASGRGRLFSRLLKWRHPRTGAPLRLVGAFRHVEEQPKSFGPPVHADPGVQVQEALFSEDFEGAQWSAADLGFLEEGEPDELPFDELQNFFGLG
jgi:hypothetical protein